MMRRSSEVDNDDDISSYMTTTTMKTPVKRRSTKTNPTTKKRYRSIKKKLFDNDESYKETSSSTISFSSTPKLYGNDTTTKQNSLIPPECSTDIQKNIYELTKRLKIHKERINELKKCQDKLMCQDYHGKTRGDAQIIEQSFNKIKDKLRKSEKEYIEIKQDFCEEFANLFENTCYQYNIKITQIIHKLFIAQYKKDNTKLVRLEKGKSKYMSKIVNTISLCLKNYTLSSMKTSNGGFFDDDDDDKSRNDKNCCTVKNSDILKQLYHRLFVTDDDCGKCMVDTIDDNEDNDIMNLNNSIKNNCPIVDGVYVVHPINILNLFGNEFTTSMYDRLERNLYKILLNRPHKFMEIYGDKITTCFVNLFMDTEEKLKQEFRLELLASKLIKYLFVYVILNYIKTIFQVLKNFSEFDKDNTSRVLFKDDNGDSKKSEFNTLFVKTYCENLFNKEEMDTLNLGNALIDNLPFKKELDNLRDTLDIYGFAKQYKNVETEYGTS